MLQHRLIQPLLQQLWHWFIEPSPKLTEPSQRRQAVLLSAILLSLIVLGIVLEVIYAFSIGLAAYHGFLAAFVVFSLVTLIYAFSRTQYIQFAAILGVVVTSLAIFAMCLSSPRNAVNGLFDYIILPLWLGSLFIDLKKLPLLIIAILAGLLMMPLLVPVMSFNDILTGPFSFVFATSILLLLLTRHRNGLEQDRRAELSAKELQSRREAARADALLRVSGRLNAQLDLDAVLAAIGEEVSYALNTPVAIVSLFDPVQNHLYAAAGVGVSPDFIASVPIFPGAAYEALVSRLRGPMAFPDLQTTALPAFLRPLKSAQLCSMAFVTMEYANEHIGSLSAITQNERRDFTHDELLLLQGIAAQAALALVNTRLYKDARRRLERLQALHTIDIAIATNRDLRENLQVLLDNITEQLKVDAAVFLLLDEQNQQLGFVTSIGFHAPTPPFTPLGLGEGIAGRAALERRIISIPDLRQNAQAKALTRAIASEGFVSFYAAPLIAQEKVKGVLELFHRSLLTPDPEWLGFLQALADQAAIAIESTTLFDDLQHANDDLSHAYDSTIEGWSHALDLRDRETEGHTQRVTKMTVHLAQTMGFSADKIVQVRRGALLHDIGKMGVPDSILLKPGPLTEAEWNIMRRHPQLAYEMLSPIEYLNPALEIPYCHHEKWDGTGYPQGLKGEQIPMAARIFTLADVYDALTSNRSYRRAWTKEKTVEHIRALSGTHFDPQLVDLLLHEITKETAEPEGSAVSNFSIQPLAL